MTTNDTTPVPRPEDIRCAQDALAVIQTAVSERDTLVALLLSDGRSSGAAINFAELSDDDVPSVVQMLCEAAPADGELILASIRPDGNTAASMDEVEAWFQYQQIAADEHVQLIDWFLVSRNQARSMAETTFSEDRW